MKSRGTLPILFASALGVGCVGDIGGDDPVELPGGETTDALCADTPFVRRLTVAEYVETIRAQLGVDIASEAAEQLPADLRTDGFTNTAGSLIVTLDHAEVYEELATLVVEQIDDFGALLTEHAPCSDFGEACERPFIESIAREIYRAEVGDEELVQLRGLFVVVDEEGESFEQGARLVVRSMLQSPRFLYRMEHERGDGAARPLTSVELANRLSYLLWSGPPDDELREAADRGELVTDEQIVATVERMLADPRARATSRRYLTDWLNLRRLDNLQRDPDLFPDWDPALGLDMKQETLDYFEYLVWEKGRPLSDLYDAEVTFVSEALANHYGFEGGASGEVDLSELDSRGGLLTQGSVASVGGNTSSMVGRGLFILETFLCGEIDSPPPGIDTTPPVVEPGKSQRTYSEERVENPSCSGCHKQMEPVAWGIERFNAVGVYTTEDPFGNPLLEDGYVQFPGVAQPVSYETSAELMEVLAGADGTMSCFSEKATQFAMGRPFSPHDDEGDKCAVEGIEESFLASGRTYSELMVAIATNPVFRTIRTSEE